MTRDQVEMSRHYIVRIKGAETVVKIVAVNPRGGWFGMNVQTGRDVKIKTGARLKRIASDFECDDAYRFAVQGVSA